MLHLASQSPRRRELLQQLGIDFKLLRVEVPERRKAGEDPARYVERVAHAKAQAGVARLDRGEEGPVLAADTDVVLDGEVLGKPADAGEAAGMLGRLSGRMHEVVSVVWVMNRRREACLHCVSRVRFGTLDEAAINAYVATREPFDKAGAYAIQGRAAAFISRLEGSYSNVVGLPLYETATLLHRFGIIVPA